MLSDFSFNYRSEVMKTVIEQLVELQGMNVKQLKEKWLQVFKKPSPKSVTPEFLIRRLIYRIQELENNGKDSVLEARLKENAERHFKKKVAVKPLPGSVLTKEYHGVEHQVSVKEDGFVYEGMKFGSLSAIARRITGMSWSGPVFFGLK